MSIPEQPGQTEPALTPNDEAAARTVDFLLAHAGLTASLEERAWLVRAYTVVAPLLADLHGSPARYAEPAFTFDAQR